MSKISRTLLTLFLVAVVPISFISAESDPTGLNLPSHQVTAIHKSGSDSFFDIELSGVGDGYDVSDGVYPGWCLEDNHMPNTETVTLLSSYSPNLPPGLQTCTSGACAGDEIPWDKLNYLLNHKVGGKIDIQAAVWLLIWQVSETYTPTALSHQMVDDANANGDGFVPAAGEIVAVILRTHDGVGIGEEGYQDTIIEVPRGMLGCRVTGGGNDSAGQATDGSWDGTFAYKNARGKGSRTQNQYTFGGQAGANTGQQPQPKGEWTHHQSKGPDGSFVFHAGTASAPEGTEIDLIVCSDPGWCDPAREAPAKQIDFEGVGTFKNIKDPSAPLADVIPGETFHWFEVHIEDLGEPGKSGKFKEPDTYICPTAGSAGGLANCDCPDYYSITIYAGYNPGSETPDKSTVIYSVSGYIDGGNLQIHPPTGFDQ